MKLTILIMNTLSLCWHLLSIIGTLPEELIVKIVFHYSGIRHPIVNMLLNSTKVKEYENLQRLPFSKSIYKFYLNPEKYSSLFGINIITFINNKQCSYFRDCSSYIHYKNPGYFIPRQFGRLDYNVLNDLDMVETKIHVDWKLNRSRRILESIKCNNYKCTRGMHSCNEFNEIKNLSTIKNTHKLMLFEKTLESDKKMSFPFGTHVNNWTCNICSNNY